MYYAVCLHVFVCACVHLHVCVHVCLHVCAYLDSCDCGVLVYSTHGMPENNAECCTRTFCLFYFQTGFVSEPAASLMTRKSQRQRSSYLPRLPRTTTFINLWSLLVFTMRSGDSKFGFMLILWGMFPVFRFLIYNLKIPKMILLYLFFPGCFVLNASQWDNNVLWEENRLYVSLELPLILSLPPKGSLLKCRQVNWKAIC